MQHNRFFVICSVLLLHVHIMHSCTPCHIHDKASDCQFYLSPLMYNTVFIIIQYFSMINLTIMKGYTLRLVQEASGYPRNGTSIGMSTSVLAMKYIL